MNNKALEHLKKELRMEASAWRTPSSDREWDKVRLIFKRNSEYQASVKRSQRCTYTIEIYEGVPVLIYRSLKQVLSDENFWRLSWVRESSIKVNIHQADITPLLSSELGNTQWTANFLTLQAVRFLFYHEMAHVVRGHLYYAHHIYGKTGTSFCYQEKQTTRLSPKEKRTYRTFEVDADIVGSDLFVEMTAFESWKARPIATRKAFAILLFYAAGFSFLVLDTQNKKINQHAIHPQPMVRYLVAIDILAGSISKSLSLKGKQLDDAAIEAFFYLRKAAKTLEHRKSGWRNNEKESLKTFLEAQAMTLEAYQSELDELMGERSTLIPPIRLGL